MSQNFNRDQEQNITDLLKGLSHNDFLTLGIENVAYVREVVDGHDQAYVVHAADGSILSVMETLPSALEVVQDSNLSPVRLH